MKVARWAFPLLILALFSASILTFRSLGVWRARGRLPPPEALEPAPKAPVPGGLPM